ncbi:MAG: tRNA (guanosine(46)-N7)-methyltransferase TrmB [Arachnia sp.]
MTLSSSRTHRVVRSFVRRSTRMNDSQRRAWDRYADTFVIPVPTGDHSTSISTDANLDWARVFGREAPLAVEIGSGAGESLVAMAQRRPERDIVAFEVFAPAVASTLSRIGRAGVKNVRIVVADGTEGLERLCVPGGVAELWTFFADPWHKARHHKRRLVSGWFADLAASRLSPGGLWRLATDWEDYACWQRALLDGHPLFTNVHGGWAPRPDDRPVTKYERRGLDAGRRVFDLEYRRNA